MIVKSQIEVRAARRYDDVTMRADEVADHPRRRLIRPQIWRWAAPLVVAISVCAALIATGSRWDDAGAGPTQPGAAPSVCLGLVPPGRAQGSCATGSRAVLSDAQREHAREAARAIGSTVARADGCPASTDTCAQRAARQRLRSPDVGEVEQVRRALADAGYPDAVVRVARADDPAPQDAIVYAVAVGPACVIGHLDGFASDGLPSVEGRLPNGQCLAH